MPPQPPHPLTDTLRMPHLHPREPRILRGLLLQPLRMLPGLAHRYLGGLERPVCFALGVLGREDALARGRYGGVFGVAVEEAAGVVLGVVVAVVGEGVAGGGGVEGGGGGAAPGEERVVAVGLFDDWWGVGFHVGGGARE